MYLCAFSREAFLDGDSERTVDWRGSDRCWDGPRRVDVRTHPLWAVVTITLRKFHRAPLPDSTPCGSRMVRLAADAPINSPVGPF